MDATSATKILSFPESSRLLYFAYGICFIDGRKLQITVAAKSSS